MNVYFVRHGQSEGNLNKTYQGSDVSISEKGKKQVRLVARRLKDKKIDVIYASPYLRAKQTVEIIAKKLCLPVKYNDQLKEIKRPSVLEGLKYGDPKASKIKKIIRENQIKADWRFSDDESFNDLLMRARQVQKQIFEHHRDQNILCVSHITIIVMIVLQTILEDKLIPEVFWQFYYHSRQKNTGITQLEFTEKFGWNLVTWNDTTHLQLLRLEIAFYVKKTRERFFKIAWRGGLRNRQSGEVKDWDLWYKWSAVEIVFEDDLAG